MPTWRFKSVPRQVAATHMGHVWRWQTETREGVRRESIEVFHTLDACVRDAQQNGFTGDINEGTRLFSALGYEIRISDRDSGVPLS
jgi:hypothetical protein